MHPENKNSVFIATSIDGYIADRNGGIEWLTSFPDPENNDMGYGKLMARIDALVMGRVSFETVCGFNIDWPYTKPVFVYSNTLKEIPAQLQDKAILVKGTVKEVLAQVHSKGYHRLYIDGGKTIQGFLQDDLIDDMVITTVPYLLGGGVPLFGTLPGLLKFNCIETELFSTGLAQRTFVRQR